MIPDSDPLDSTTHERYLDRLTELLTQILDELKKLRKDIQRLPQEMTDR